MTTPVGGPGGPGEKSDAELLQGSVEDPELFGIFYDRHVSALLSFFYRRTASGQPRAQAARRGTDARRRPGFGKNRRACRHPAPAKCHSGGSEAAPSDLVKRSYPACRERPALSRGGPAARMLRERGTGEGQPGARAPGRVSGRTLMDNQYDFISRLRRDLVESIERRRGSWRAKLADRIRSNQPSYRFLGIIVSSVLVVSGIVFPVLQLSGVMLSSAAAKSAPAQPVPTASIQLPRGVTAIVTAYSGVWA